MPNKIKKTDIHPDFLPLILNQTNQQAGGTGEYDLQGSKTLVKEDSGKVGNNYSGAGRAIFIPTGLPNDFVFYAIAGGDGSEITVNWNAAVTNINGYKPPLILSWDEENKSSGILRIKCTGTANKYDFKSDNLRFNEAPVVTPVLTGTKKVGNVLTVNDNYTDAENDLPGTHAYEWYSAGNSSMTGATLISGATGNSYTLTASEANKYIQVKVTPYALSGASPGASKLTPAYGVIAAATSGTTTPGNVVKIDVNRYGSSSDAEWNQFSVNQPVSGVTATGLKNSAGATTGIGIKITADFSGGNENTSFDTSGPNFPSTVLNQAIRTNSGVTGKVQITGLNNANTYDVRVIGHTGLSQYNNTTQVTINNTNKTFVATNNSANDALFEKVVPTGGVIELALTGTQDFGWLSGIIITEFTTTP